MSVLEVKNLVKYFADTQVLNGVSLDIQKGEVISIIGSSGSGKTTLLRCIDGLETADSGLIVLDGEPIFSGEDKKIATSAQARQKRLKLDSCFSRSICSPI